MIIYHKEYRIFLSDIFRFRASPFTCSKYFPCPLCFFFSRRLTLFRFISLQGICLFGTRFISPPPLSCNDFFDQCSPLRISDIFCHEYLPPQTFAISRIFLLLSCTDFFSPMIIYHRENRIFIIVHFSISSGPLCPFQVFPLPIMVSLPEKIYLPYIYFLARYLPYRNQNMFPNMNPTPCSYFTLHSTSCRVFAPSENFTTRIYSIAIIFPI